MAAISPYFLTAEDVVLSTGKSYLNMSFYNLDEKTTSTIELKSWDLAFVVAGQNGAIHINSGAGTKLYEVVGKSTENFDDNIDTTGLSTNTELFKEWRDSDSTWAIGAFNCGMNGFDGSGDFGWGSYDMSTHGIIGNKLFLIKDYLGNFYKIMIEDLIGGAFTFTYSNLDNSNKQTYEIKKADYPNQTLAFFNLSDPNKQVKALEFWSLWFGKYVATVYDNDGNPAPYNVNGIRTNAGYATLKMEVEDPSTAEAPANFDLYSPKISTIGHEWKALDGNMQWYIPENLVYFVLTPDEKVYRIYFKTFGGMSTGETTFDATEVHPNSISEFGNTYSFTLAPNVVDGGEQVNLLFNASATAKANVSVFDILGNEVFTNTIEMTGFNYYSFNPSLSNGSYFVRISIGEKSEILRLIVR